MISCENIFTSHPTIGQFLHCFLLFQSPHQIVWSSIGLYFPPKILNCAYKNIKNHTFNLRRDFPSSSSVFSPDSPSSSYVSGSKGLVSMLRKLGILRKSGPLVPRFARQRGISSSIRVGCISSSSFSKFMNGCKECLSVLN